MNKQYSLHEKIILANIFELNESILEICPKIKRLTKQVEREATTVWCLLRNRIVRNEIRELYNNQWSYIIGRFVTPSILKLKVLCDEGNKVADSNYSKKLDYFTVINKEITLLYDGLYQYCQIFRLSLLQILSTDQNLGVNGMEE